MNRTPRSKHFHGLVLMGISLTGATLACGGIASNRLAEGDAGVESGADAYPTIGPYPTIDGGSQEMDHYPTIRPDGYPMIAIDAGADAYPTIGIGQADGYPIILPASGDT